MEIYFAIVNLLDYQAKHGIDKKLLAFCYELLPYIEGDCSLSKIQSIAEANDCGLCDDFETAIERLKELFERSERI